MSGVVYRPDEAATQMLGRSVEMMSFVQTLATQAAAHTRELAPVLTGTYRDSIKADARILEGKATGLVFSDDFKALWIEYGTETNPTFAPLRKGVERVGLKVKAQ